MTEDLPYLRCSFEATDRAKMLQVLTKKLRAVYKLPDAKTPAADLFQLYTMTRYMLRELAHLGGQLQIMLDERGYNTGKIEEVA